MMKNQELARWVLVNAIGFGIAFVALLQTGMLFEFGFNWDLHWNWVEVPVSQTSNPYFATAVSCLVGGIILGLAQSLSFRTRGIGASRWVGATAFGFVALAVIVDWPLIALDMLGAIAGPVEPIIVTIGGGTFAGVLQYLALRRKNIKSMKWLVRWIAGLVVSLVPLVGIFVTLEALNVPINWPTETFISGFVVGGVAAFMSGRALFAALPAR